MHHSTTINQVAAHLPATGKAAAGADQKEHLRYASLNNNIIYPATPLPHRHLIDPRALHEGCPALLYTDSRLGSQLPPLFYADVSECTLIWYDVVTIRLLQTENTDAAVKLRSAVAEGEAQLARIRNALHKIVREHRMVKATSGNGERDGAGAATAGSPSSKGAAGAAAGETTTDEAAAAAATIMAGKEEPADSDASVSSVKGRKKATARKRGCGGGASRVKHQAKAAAAATDSDAAMESDTSTTSTETFTGISSQ